MKKQIFALLTLVSVFALPVSQSEVSLLSLIPKQEVVLAEHQLDLSSRNPNPQINEVFAYNILLALDYFEFSFTLKPGEIFAFHENVASEFRKAPLQTKSDLVKTGWTKYTAKEGYKTVLGLPGNGVCHLASLMNWTAQEAGLEVVAKVNHNFAPVPGVPKKYGTSIRYTANGSRNTQNQNLYIKNNFQFPVKFVFEADNDKVELKITKFIPLTKDAFDNKNKEKERDV